MQANFARWEPRHGQFRFRHPWKQYLKIGTLARQCAYKIDALNGHLNSVSQVNKSTQYKPLTKSISTIREHAIYTYIDSQVRPEIREHYKKTCTRLSLESGKALKELSHGMKQMKRISTLTAKDHVKEVKSEAEELKSLLGSKGLESEGFSLLDLLQVATIASMLIEIATCTEEIAEAVHQLGSLVNLKPVVESSVAPEEAIVKRVMKIEERTDEKASSKDSREGDGHVVVVINEVVRDGFSEKLHV